MAISVDYYGATWCKVCVVIKPTVQKMLADFGVTFTEYDIDELEGDERVQGITKVPTIRVFKDSVLIQEIITGHLEALKNLLAENKSIVLTEDF